MWFFFFPLWSLQLAGLWAHVQKCNIFFPFLRFCTCNNVLMPSISTYLSEYPNYLSTFTSCRVSGKQVRFFAATTLLNQFTKCIVVLLSQKHDKYCQCMSVTAVTQSEHSKNGSTAAVPLSVEMLSVSQWVSRWTPLFCHFNCPHLPCPHLAFKCHLSRCALGYKRSFLVEGSELGTSQWALCIKSETHLLLHQNFKCPPMDIFGVKFFQWQAMKLFRCSNLLSKQNFFFHISHSQAEVNDVCLSLSTHIILSQRTQF